MADREGNVLLPPGGIRVGAEVKGDEILASYARFTQKGCTLKTGQGVLEGGALLVKETATGKYVKYASGASGVSGIKGVLRHSVDTSSGDRLGNIVISGVIKRSKILAAGHDAAAVTAAETALNARSDSDRDYFIV